MIEIFYKITNKSQMTNCLKYYLKSINDLILKLGFIKYKTQHDSSSCKQNIYKLKQFEF